MIKKWKLRTKRRTRRGQGYLSFKQSYPPYSTMSLRVLWPCRARSLLFLGHASRASRSTQRQNVVVSCPRHSMGLPYIYIYYIIYIYIDASNHPNVGIYGIHGVSGCGLTFRFKSRRPHPWRRSPIEHARRAKLVSPPWPSALFR